MAKNHAAELKTLIEQAEANGWTYIGNNTVRRMAEHVTPQFALDNGWAPGSTYTSLEFLSFVLNSNSTRVPKVVHKTMRCPWVARSDRSISYRRAVELLAQPLHLSEIHDH